jgi:hypothetical protein
MPWGDLPGICSAQMHLGFESPGAWLDAAVNYESTHCGQIMVEAVPPGYESHDSAVYVFSYETLVRASHSFTFNTEK